MTEFHQRGYERQLPQAISALAEPPPFVRLTGPISSANNRFHLRSKAIIPCLIAPKRTPGCLPAAALGHGRVRWPGVCSHLAFDAVEEDTHIKRTVAPSTVSMLTA